MSLAIRPAEPRDAETIAEFNIRLARETEDLPLDPACVGPGVIAVLSDPAKGRYFVAEVDGAVAGQIMVTYEWSDWRNGNIWWIQSVYVTEPFRRAGVFRALYQHLKALAEADPGVCALRLYVHGTNERAQSSYEKLGMHRTEYQVFELELTKSTN
jgi:ribosomal protein S18 acetylase RimI-like enzyme